MLWTPTRTSSGGTGGGLRIEFVMAGENVKISVTLFEVDVREGTTSKLGLTWV